MKMGTALHKLTATTLPFPTTEDSPVAQEGVGNENFRLWRSKSGRELGRGRMGEGVYGFGMCLETPESMVTTFEGVS